MSGFLSLQVEGGGRTICAMKWPRVCLAVLLSLAFVPNEADGQSRRRGRAVQREVLREIDTASYRLYTDVDESELRGVVQRLEAMAQEYQRRTAELSGRADDRRLPFYLYRDIGKYHQAGGDAGTAGFFDGERLLAYIGERADSGAWSTIQHEAFHQFLAAKLGHELPIWLNEGLAEYFAEARFTGDAFISGLTPPWRVKRVQERIRSGSLPLIADLVMIPHDQWNEAKQIGFYDMAWSVVHFLAHTEGGAGQGRLVALIREGARGGNPLKALEEQIGPVGAVQQAWERYWLEMDVEKTWDAFAEVAVQTVCSFYWRALAAGEKPKDLRELMAVARQGRMGGEPLPAELLEDVVVWAGEMGEWTLADEKQKQVTLEREGVLVCARANVQRGQVVGVTSWIDTPDKAKR